MQPGTRLGPYEVVSRIAAGGMGEVWRARDTRLEREVAIKILPAQFAADAQLKIRFQREAKTISHLAHPNICSLFDVGDDYLVMELLDGEPLSDRLKRAPLPPADAIRFGAQIAEALAGAHREGVIHRDLKPANVMLTRSGAKLLDFGLAKSGAASSSSEGETVQKPLTEPGVVLGTFQYMAPEQIAGAEADARTDIFALGAVLYEMCTGRPAFQGTTRTSLVAAIVGSDPPPISESVPVAPPALDHVIRKCLEKDPDHRWQSAHDVAEELKWIGGGSGATAVPQTPRRLTAAVAVGIAAALIVAIVASGWILLRRRPSDLPNVSFSIPSTTDQYDRAFGCSLSPDGTRVVFTAADTSGRGSLWMRPLDKLGALPIAGTENGSWPFWSEDGRFLFFIRSGTLFRIAAGGGPVQEIAACPVTENFGAAANADGVVLFSTGSRGLQRVDPGGTAYEFTKVDPARFEIGHVFPTFLPDGKRFLFLALVRNPRAPDDTQHLYAGSLDSGERTFIGSVSSCVQYDRSGYLLMVRDGALVAVRFDAARLRLSGDALPVASPVSWFRPSARAFFSLAATGTLAFSPPPPSTPLQWLAPDGTVRRSFIGRELSSNGAIRVSPNGHDLLIANVDRKAGTTHLWLWGLDHETQTALSFDQRVKFSPVFAADGTRVYYASDVTGFPDIYERVIGEMQERFIVGGPGYQVPQDVSPDGRYLMYRTTERTPQSAIHVLRLDQPSTRATPFVATPAGVGSARFSPDGRWVAYACNETGRNEIYVKPFPGPGAARQLTSGGGYAPRWSADGKRIYFVRDDRALYVTEAERAGGNLDARRTLEFASDIVQFEVLRDGSYLVQLEQRRDSAAHVMTNWTRVLPR